MKTPFFDRHKQALKAACRKPDHPLYARSNDELDEAISAIKAEQPESFLTEADLKDRCFVHAPPEGREVHYKFALRYTLCAAERAERASFDKARRLSA